MTILTGIFIFISIVIFSLITGKLLFGKLDILHKSNWKMQFYLTGCAIVILGYYYTVIFFLFSIDHIAYSIILSFTLITIIIFLLLFIDSYAKNNIAETEIEQHKKSLKNLTSYSNHLEQINNDVRAFRHDYRNILASINEYVKEKKYMELDELLNKQIIPNSEHILKSTTALEKLSNVKIPGLKGLLISKFYIAQESGIEILIEVEKPFFEIDMDLVDLVRIVGIVLDNAIEACKDINEGKKVMFFAVIASDTGVVFKCLNTFCIMPDIYSIMDKNYSTKSKGRGLGLYNLKSLAEKYDNVVYEIKINTNNEFEFTLAVNESI